MKHTELSPAIPQSKTKLKKRKGPRVKICRKCKWYKEEDVSFPHGGGNCAGMDVLCTKPIIDLVSGEINPSFIDCEKAREASGSFQNCGISGFWYEEKEDDDKEKDS
jgi:hypothetical protein